MTQIVRACVIAAVVAGFAAQSARAQDGEAPDRFADRLHSDLPIFAGGPEAMWPRPASSGDGESVGCGSRVEFGVWALAPVGEDVDGAESWYRIENYGVFHCFAVVGSSPDRAELETADAKPSFFVEIEASSGRELWALQIGTVPGSDYLLLSRDAGDGAISRFDVLQTRCPKRNVRDRGAIEILKTRYCAINSKKELRNFARRMAKLEPRGELKLIESDKEQ